MLFYQQKGAVTKMRKTKIICTLGPASDNEPTLREMMLAGMNVARINFSHGSYSEHKQKADLVKKLRDELGLHTALLLDTKGPEIRLKKFAKGKVELKEGQKFVLYTGDEPGDENGVAVTYDNLCKDISIGGTILMDDGLIGLTVESVKNGKIICRVDNNGVISDNKGVNVPGVKLSIPFLSEKDKKDIAFGVKEDFDFIAASFTQNAKDVRDIRAELDKLGCDSIRIIAKIENSAGVENIDEIINEADGIMIARGDMGVEIPMEEIPLIQKKLITKCYVAGKQVITATQMLESMTHNPRPTRAEITDVANAIFDGTSAIMLSGETAAGLYPVEAVRTMARIAERAESEYNYEQRFRGLDIKVYANVTNAVSHATCTTAHDLKAAAIVTVTKSGLTARLISRFRPEIDIIGCSPFPKACRHMSMSWGVTPILIDEKENTDELLSHAVEEVFRKGMVKYGDLVVITAGLPVGVSGTTNMLKVQIVGDVLVSGQGIVPETVCGTLCVCKDENEALEQFHDGDILVIPNATEKILRMLRYAKAIVCERDGRDSYAAIVGQALNIPVIVGAENATKILRSGTTVNVDGVRGIVYCSDIKDEK